ncbi:Tm-1-like ATP-binding domain-containing protein [Yoonia sp.]|uniref:Tm-1-like ATP-binding domain-containing protein n=1 Tax=Yoonia sp. TaxID=2212373 RepID=UPI002FD8DD9C
MSRVLLIGTIETKRAELAALAAALTGHGLRVCPIDISLGAGGAVLQSEVKLSRMQEKGQQAATEAAAQADGCLAAVALGGGTGGELAVSVLQALPPDVPKVLVTTLAFDPRLAVADCGIVLVPTTCDIEGVNTMLLGVFEATAAMVAGLAQARPVMPSGRRAIAVSTLGATGAAGSAVISALSDRGAEATVFHANGCGGAAFARFLREGRADGIIDLNVHELGRMRIAGLCAPMPDRFTAGGHLPRIVLPGALNFLGLGAPETLGADHRARPHYRHTGNFTHVALTEDEMADQAAALSDALNTASGPTHVLIPMGGFSHEDRPGGAIENPRLRALAAEVLETSARAYGVTRLPYHINAPETADAAVEALFHRMPK